MKTQASFFKNNNSLAVIIFSIHVGGAARLQLHMYFKTFVERHPKNNGDPKGILSVFNKNCIFVWQSFNYLCTKQKNRHAFDTSYALFFKYKRKIKLKNSNFGKIGILY